MRSPANPSKILPVTSVRFLAAFYVVLYHARGFITPGPDSATITSRILSLGYISVSFFFFLSGFVLAVAYLNTARPLPIRAFPVRRFLVARFARIYPILFACLVLDLPHFIYVERHLVHRPMSDILATLAVSFGAVEAWFPKVTGLDMPSWSISAEAFFYLLFPLLGPFVWAIKRPRLTWFAVAIYLAGNLFVLSLMHLGVDNYAMGFYPFTHVYEFILGICLARLFLHLSANAALMARLASYAPIFLIASALAFLSIPVLNLQVPMMLLQHGVLIPLYALVLLALASGNRLVANIFSRPAFVLLGEASFALYLLHEPLEFILRRFMTAHSRIGLPLYLALAITLSVLSFFWLETPARRWITRRAHSVNPESALTRALAQ